LKKKQLNKYLAQQIFLLLLWGRGVAWPSFQLRGPLFLLEKEKAGAQKENVLRRFSGERVGDLSSNLSDPTSKNQKRKQEKRNLIEFLRWSGGF